MRLIKQLLQWIQKNCRTKTRNLLLTRPAAARATSQQEVIRRMAALPHPIPSVHAFTHSVPIVQTFAQQATMRADSVRKDSAPHLAAASSVRAQQATVHVTAAATPTQDTATASVRSRATVLVTTITRQHRASTVPSTGSARNKAAMDSTHSRAATDSVRNKAATDSSAVRAATGSSARVAMVNVLSKAATAKEATDSVHNIANTLPTMIRTLSTA